MQEPILTPIAGMGTGRHLPAVMHSGWRLPPSGIVFVVASAVVTSLGPSDVNRILVVVIRPGEEEGDDIGEDGSVTTVRSTGDSERLLFSLGSAGEGERFLLFPC